MCLKRRLHIISSYLVLFLLLQIPLFLSAHVQLLLLLTVEQWLTFPWPFLNLFLSPLRLSNWPWLFFPVLFSPVYLSLRATWFHLDYCLSQCTVVFALPVLLLLYWSLDFYLYHSWTAFMDLWRWTWRERGRCGSAEATHCMCHSGWTGEEWETVCYLDSLYLVKSSCARFQLLNWNKRVRTTTACSFHILEVATVAITAPHGHMDVTYTWHRQAAVYIKPVKPVKGKNQKQQPKNYFYLNTGVLENKRWVKIEEIQISLITQFPLLGNVLTSGW